MIPANPQSALQTAQREALADTLTMWQSIKLWAKSVWNTYAEGYAKSGYNRYMEDNILMTKAGTAGLITPFNAEYVAISAQAAAAGAEGIITCSWTDLTVFSTDYVEVYYRKTETLAEVYAWTAGGTPALVSAETLELSGLDTGEEYEIGFFPYSEDKAECQQSFNKVLVSG